MQRYQLRGAGRSQPAWLPDSSGFAVEVPGADYLGVSLARYSVHTAPGTDGLIPGLTIASAAIVPAIAP